MSILQQIERDLKAALLGGDKVTTEALRTVKSTLQNEAISLGVRDAGLDDEQAQKVLAKESKKRTEAAELYQKAGAEDRAKAELNEKSIIDKYLPEQMDEAAVKQIVQEEVAKIPQSTPADMGKIIGAVRAKTGGAADGGLIAKLVKESIEQNG